MCVGKHVHIIIFAVHVHWFYCLCYVGLCDKLMCILPKSLRSNYLFQLILFFVCLGADTVRFKAEINFDGREVARVHVSRLDLEKLLKVHVYRLLSNKYMSLYVPVEGLRVPRVLGNSLSSL